MTTTSSLISYTIKKFNNILYVVCFPFYKFCFLNRLSDGHTLQSSIMSKENIIWEEGGVGVVKIHCIHV